MHGIRSTTLSYAAKQVKKAFHSATPIRWIWHSRGYFLKWNEHAKSIPFSKCLHGNRFRNEMCNNNVRGNVIWNQVWILYHLFCFFLRIFWFFCDLCSTFCICLNMCLSQGAPFVQWKMKKTIIWWNAAVLRCFHSRLFLAFVMWSGYRLIWIVYRWYFYSLTHCYDCVWLRLLNFMHT